MSTIYRLLPRELALAGLLILAGSFQSAMAQRFGQLEEGGEVSVDRTTNRATVNRDGVNSQLWDGVHTLKDGSTITIHSGQIVPNESIIRSRQLAEQPQEPDEEPWAGKPIAGQSPCQLLVQRVCGPNGGCQKTTACSAAQQLLTMEWQERRSSGNPGYTTPGSGQCQNAESDTEFFASCMSGR